MHDRFGGYNRSDDRDVRYAVVRAAEAPDIYRTVEKNKSRHSLLFFVSENGRQCNFRVL